MKRNRFVLVLGLGLLAGGCGGGAPPNRDAVFPIKGTVTYNGRPVVGADVTFLCQEKDRAAFGRTDKDGAFKLTTFLSNDGAVAGKHAVSVALVESVAPTAKVAPLDSPDYAPPTMADALRAPKPKRGLPVKYGDVRTSDLVVEVKEGENPDVKLELKD